MPNSLSEYCFSDCFNTSFLQNNFSQKLQFYLTLCNVFTATVPEQLELLQESIANKNYVDTKKILHKVKNNYYWMGLLNINENLVKAEEACHNLDFDWSKAYKLHASMQRGLTDVENEKIKLNEFISKNLE